MLRIVFLVIYLTAAAIAVLLFNADTANGEAAIALLAIASLLPDSADGLDDGLAGLVRVAQVQRQHAAQEHTLRGRGGPNHRSSRCADDRSCRADAARVWLRHRPAR